MPHNSMTRGELQRIRELRCQLWSQQEIADELGYCRGSIGKRLRKMGLTGRGDPVYGAVRALLIAEATDAAPGAAYVRSRHLADDLPCSHDFVGRVLRDIADSGDPTITAEKWNSSRWAVELVDDHDLDVDKEGVEA